MASPSLIHSPDSPELDTLCEELRSMGQKLEQSKSQWPTDQVALIQQAGVGRWFVPKELGGLGWAEEEITRGYLKLSAACLTTTFIMTQHVAALKRILASENRELRERLIKTFLEEEALATVGISHLTTSRRHLEQPVLSAVPTEQGFCLNGFSPWVTGANNAHTLVVGAELENGEQILVAVGRNAEGIKIEPGFQMIALTASHTGPVRFHDVPVSREALIAGPRENVMATKKNSATGGLQTSTLAAGVATAAIDFLGQESKKRPELEANYRSLQSQLDQLTDDLLQAAIGSPNRTREELRTDANSLVLRSTQAAMVAAKGAGFVLGHPVGRWCREAFFFLVWSCPQSVSEANLCELAGSVS